MDIEKTAARVPVRDLVRSFMRLGLLGFGGPVARAVTPRLGRP